MYTNAKKNILIADDSVFFRIKLSSILEQAGHKVTQVKNGMEVIEEIKKYGEDIDLLVLDMQMPEVDGFAVTDWLGSNEDFATFPVVVISGTYDVETIKDKLSGKNINSVISKDMSPDHIIYHLNEAIFEKESTARESPRVPSTIPSDFIYNGRSGTGFLLSISTTGAFIHARENFEIGKNMDLSFTVENTDTLINVTGKIARMTESEKENTLFEGVGVTFENLKDSDKKIIEEYVKKELATIRWHRDI